MKRIKLRAQRNSERNEVTEPFYKMKHRDILIYPDTFYLRLVVTFRVALVRVRQRSETNMRETN